MADAVGAEDAQITDGVSGSTPSLQSILCKVVDNKHLALLGERLHSSGRDRDVRRLRELRSMETDHTWMFSVNPIHGPVLPPDLYSTAVRMRLGADLIDDDIVCAQCSHRVLDSQGYHALCCNTAEATIGHNRIKEVLHAGFVLSDPGANMEAAGLVSSNPGLRPADILTRSALPNTLTAVDVGVKSPEAAGSGEDCAQAMVEEKLRYYANVLPELEQAGIRYQPVTFSCYGRRHQITSRIMQQAAILAARSRGLSDHKPLLRRWHCTVSTEIWRRAANMARSCFPKASADAELLLEDAG